MASRQLDAVSLTTGLPGTWLTSGEFFFYISHENKPPLFSDFILQQKSPVMSKSAHRRLLTDIRSTEDQTDIEKWK